ncbi:hypothetical protein [Mobilicoccus massiliensis]|uniref:hypothetical protein n=1 Tax=Mobilicoccus massiliensis TaxID=1522310 RepID=UPI00058EB1F2|nr:hypothetical protein [Mobilicoccus massiliensis]
MADDRRDDDPTGIRRLLSTMADSQPVPDDLAARIAHRLEAEEREQDHGARCHFDPAVSSPGRRRATIAVSAGALSLAAVVVSAAFVFHIDDDVVGTQAAQAFARLQTAGRVPSHGVVDADDPAQEATVPPAEHDADDDGQRGTAVTVLASGIEYRRGRLTEQVLELLTRRDASVASPQGHASGEPVAPAPETRRCLESMSLEGHDTLVDTATFDGTPALVLVSGRGVGRDDHPSGGTPGRTVTVVPTTCGTDDVTTPLAGPYRVQ